MNNLQTSLFEPETQSIIEFNNRRQEITRNTNIIIEATYRLLPTLTDPLEVKKLKDTLLSYARSLSLLHVEAYFRIGELQQGGLL